MKQLTRYSFFVAFALVFTFSQSNADTYTIKRKNCWGFLSWRYKAGAQVRSAFQSNPLCRQEQGKCSGEASAYCNETQYGKTAIAQARSSSSVNYQYTWSNGWFLYAGYPNNALFSSRLLEDEPDGSSSAEISSNLDFASESSNNLSATSFTGNLSILNINGADFSASYEIIAWAPVDENDETITDSKTVWKSSITLTAEGVSGTGIFADPSTYTMSQTADGGLRVTFNFPNGIQVALPDGQNLELYTRAHSGQREQPNQLSAPVRSEQEYQQQQQQLLESFNLETFEVYPVPSNTETQIDLVTKSDEHVTIEVYDFTGKKVKMLCDKDVKGNVKEVIELKTDASLQRGRYQILVRIGNRSFSRPILVE